MGAVVERQLAHGAAEVVLDRLLRDVQRLANLPVAHAEGGVLQYLALARRQRTPGGFVGVGHGVLRLPRGRFAIGSGQPTPVGSGTHRANVAAPVKGEGPAGAGPSSGAGLSAPLCARDPLAKDAQADSQEAERGKNESAAHAAKRREAQEPFLTTMRNAFLSLVVRGQETSDGDGFRTVLDARQDRVCVLGDGLLSIVMVEEDSGVGKRVSQTIHCPCSVKQIQLSGHVLVRQDVPGVATLGVGPEHLVPGVTAPEERGIRSEAARQPYHVSSGCAAGP